MSFKILNGSYIRSDGTNFFVRYQEPEISFETTATLLTPASSNSYTTPTGAKIMKVWVVGAGGSYSYNCDGGGNNEGQPSSVGVFKVLIDNPITITTSVGAGVQSVCDLTGGAPNTTLTITSGSTIPLYTNTFTSNGGNHRLLSIGTYTSAFVRSVDGFPISNILWNGNLTGRIYPPNFSEALTLAGASPSSHRLGMAGISSGTPSGGDGGILILLTDYEDITLAFTGTGSFNIPSSYSSAKIWAIGAGGVAEVYCDSTGQPNGGNGAVAVKTFNSVGGVTVTYNVGPAITNICGNPQNGASTTVSVNGVTMIAGGGLSNGSNGTASGSYDTSGVAGQDVSGLSLAYDEAEVTTSRNFRIFSVTIANPAVFTCSGHGLSSGQIVTFSTTGSLPTGINTSTKYYVISTGLTANTFRVSTSLGGAAVATSGSQSGTHTFTTVGRQYGVGNISSFVAPFGGMLIMKLIL